MRVTGAKQTISFDKVLIQVDRDVPYRASSFMIHPILLKVSLGKLNDSFTRGCRKIIHPRDLFLLSPLNFPSLKILKVI